MDIKGETVSVVVPIYKVEEDIEDCLQSILNQTYRRLEIILVDDGSPDRCGYIADEFAQKDERIQVIHKKNGGLSDARNAGMKIATGKYITFIDSDDKIEENFVYRLIELLKKYDADIAVCKNSVFSRRNGNVTQRNENNRFEICFDCIDATKHMLYQKEFDVSAWGKIYKTKLFNGVYYPKGLNFEDISTTYKVMIKSNRVIYTSEALYCYQIRENSIETEKFSLKKMDGIKSGNMMLLDIKENYPKLVGAARSRYVAINFHILAQIREKISEQNEIIQNIKRHRSFLLFDNEATKRVRGACLLSYFGFRFTVRILNILNQYKYKSFWRKLCFRYLYILFQ